MFKRKKKKKTGCETPEFRKPAPSPPPPTGEFNQEKEEYLVNCFCGGKVELDGGTYGYPTIYVCCSKCGGRWCMDTYSHRDAIEKWNYKMKFYR